MTHEFVEIIRAFEQAKSNNLKSVLVTVVDLNGSSYRKPGVRMLITEGGTMTGAVSGGCVEKEVLRQAESVFNTGITKVMTYDGRYRLGCEGLIYILIEYFNPNDEFILTFKNTIRKRQSFRIHSYYNKHVGDQQESGSKFYFSNNTYTVNKAFINQSEALIFEQTLPPIFRLFVFGNEHDAIELCKLASYCGWLIEVYTSNTSENYQQIFNMADGVHHIQPKEIKQLHIDQQTAVVLMTHNYAKDLAYLTELAQLSTKPKYIGILGSRKRMHQLESALLEYLPEVNEGFLDLLHGPTGLNIGAITPQEISISIISEITQKVRMPSKVLEM